MSFYSHRNELHQSTILARFLSNSLACLGQEPFQQLHIALLEGLISRTSYLPVEQRKVSFGATEGSCVLNVLINEKKPSCFSTVSLENSFMIINLYIARLNNLLCLNNIRSLKYMIFAPMCLSFKTELLMLNNLEQKPWCV